MLLSLYFVFTNPGRYGPTFIYRDFSTAIDFVIFQKAQIYGTG